MPWRIINSKLILSSLSLLFSGWLRSWRTVWMYCQIMLFKRMIGSRCCFRDAAQAVPQQIKLMVNAFAAMLSHHARVDLPLGNKLDDNYTLPDSEVQRRQLTEGNFAVVIQKLFNVRQKHKVYAHRSLIDLFTAKVLPAKAHTFAKKYCRDW